MHARGVNVAIKIKIQIRVPLWKTSHRVIDVLQFGLEG